jgi:hypothetical protein
MWSIYLQEMVFSVSPFVPLGGVVKENSIEVFLQEGTWHGGVASLTLLKQDACYCCELVARANPHLFAKLSLETSVVGPSAQVYNQALP